MLDQPGILGTGASLASDLSLLAYVLLIVPVMLIGFFFARRKMFEPHHKMVMTTITLVNWFIIFFLMAVRYSQAARSAPADASLILPTIHLAFGGTAQLLATYLVIRMWFEKQLPAWFKVRRIKRYMRTTLALWLITAALGMATYFAWYVAGASDGSAEPVATQEVTPELSGEDSPLETPAVTPEVDDDDDDDDDNSGPGSGDDDDDNSGSGNSDDNEPVATAEVAP
jgi:uncharacterized membrane protein YozB (DUF420 family)